MDKQQTKPETLTKFKKMIDQLNAKHHVDSIHVKFQKDEGDVIKTSLKDEGQLKDLIKQAELNPYS
jgi:hypothetical protein